MLSMHSNYFILSTYSYYKINLILTGYVCVTLNCTADLILNG